MIVGILVNDLNAMGGCEIVTIRLQNLLRRHNIKTVLCSLKGCNDIEAISIHARSGNYHINHRTINKMIELIVKHHIQIMLVQVNGLMSPIFSPRLLSAISDFCQVYCLIHNSPASFTKYYKSYGDISKGLGWLKRQKCVWFNIPFCKKRVDKIKAYNCNFLTLSAASQKELKKYYDLDSQIVMNALPHFETVADIDKKKRTVVYVGRIDNYQKNITGLIEAWKMCDTKRWELLIIGDGADRKKVEKYVSKCNLNNIKFLGQLDEKMVLDILCTVKVLVLSSNYEGFPTVFWEAMACKCAIVSTRFDGFPDDIMVDGINCKVCENCVVALADTLAEVLTNEEILKQLALSGYKTWLENDEGLIWNKWKQILKL